MELYDINRNALIVKPSRALIDWVNQLYPEDPIDFDNMDQHDSADVYLIPEFDDVEDAQGWLRQNYQPILESVLEEHVLDDEEWPQPLDFSLFERFCDYSVQSVVIDTVDEDYDEED